MNNDSSLKEYYVKLQNMYTNVVNMLTAINQSLSTSASEITVNVVDTDDTTSTIRIPSFLYLENKLEQLDSNMDALFNIPEDGEAWFSKASNMYQLKLVRSNTAPLTPTFNTDGVYASLTDNNILKDMVSPKTYLKMDITNLPDNVSNMFMRKIIIHNSDVFTSLQELGISSYSDYKAALYNLTEGIDYDEYDSVIDLPIKKEYYKSSFKINSIPDNSEDGGTNPWKDVSTSSALSYKLVFDTLTYYNEEDSSISYNLQVGDYLCLGNELAIYKVKSVNEDDHTVIIEEYVGHIALQTYSENSDMVFKIYNPDYSKYHYAMVPLEEDQYILVFLGTIWNNVRSILSDGYLVDLGTVLMKDADGNYIKDENGNTYSYIDYYTKYCTNLGDLILGMSQSAYSQISNYTADELQFMTTNDVIKEYVNTSFEEENLLQVVAINTHLIDDLTSEDLINLHAQKNDINAKLQTCQSNIDEVYSTLLTTDFSQNVTVTQQSLQEKIQTYYSERTELQKQLNAVVDNINSKAEDLNTTDSGTKYRIRGVSDPSLLEEYLANNYNNAEIIGLDIEYKYKTTNKDTTTLTTINGSTFTDWNKQTNIDKERKLTFSNSGYSIKYVDYNTTDNVIKWNQFDIPIQEGEDVVIRIRYKYGIGQPFINLYTPWSEEYTVVFPTEFTENQEVNSILEENAKDSITSTFNKTLIDDGYQEHIQNKVLSNEQVFFHMPENIYSGFNTSENNLISLKDKLTSMANDIEKYKSYIDGITNTAFEVYFAYDDTNVLLSPNSINKINIYNVDHITDQVIKKEMNIVIKNTGTTRLNLYSIFPGNIDTYLYDDNEIGYKEMKVNYQRVPLYINGTIEAQYLGQWIYFRQNNAYTKSDIYFNDDVQNAYDLNAFLADDANPKWTISDPSKYMKENNKQALLAYKPTSLNPEYNYLEVIKEYKASGNTKSIADIMEEYLSYTEEFQRNKTNAKGDWYTYKEAQSQNQSAVNTGDYNKTNSFLIRYEDIYAFSGNIQYQFGTDVNISEYLSKYDINLFDDTNDFVGAFLYPNLLSKSQIMTDGGLNDCKYVDTGASISIPVVFEYYVNSDTPTITKSIYFDLRNSLITNPIHFMVEVTGNYDYSASGDIYKNIDTIEG